jgi:hypothetical protein
VQSPKGLRNGRSASLRAGLRQRGRNLFYLDPALTLRLGPRLSAVPGYYQSSLAGLVVGDSAGSSGMSLCRRLRARPLFLNLPRAHAPGLDSFAPPALGHSGVGNFVLPLKREPIIFSGRS